MKNLAKATVVFLIVMLFAPLSGALAQTTNPTWHKLYVEIPSNSQISYRDSSIALDSTGAPHISYLETQTLVYAVWKDLKWESQIVDLRDVYGGISLVLDSADKPHICYIVFNDTSSSHQVMYSSYDGSGWSKQIIDKTGNSFMGSSLVLDSKGNPHVSYYSTAENSSGFFSYLMYASWNSSAWNVQSVDSQMEGYIPSSLALDSDDNPRIAYTMATGLMYASWTGSEWNIQTADQDGGFGPSLAIDSQGNPHITYDYIYTIATGYWPVVDLRYANLNGLTWSIQTIEKAFTSYGTQSSVALDVQGNPHVSYTHSDFGLMYDSWNGTNWNIQRADPAADPEDSPSLALDSNGNPHISYGNMYAYFGVLSPNPTATEKGKLTTPPLTYFEVIAVLTVITVIVVVLAVLLLRRKRRVKKSSVSLG